MMGLNLTDTLLILVFLQVFLLSQNPVEGHQHGKQFDLFRESISFYEI